MAQVLQFKIKAKDEASRELKSVKGNVEQLDKSTISLKAAMIGATAAFAALSAVSIKALKAWSEYEKAVDAVNDALRVAGVTSAKYVEVLQREASALQATTKYSDDAILTTQSLLIAYGVVGDELTRATKLTLDFATATGRDTRLAAELLGKAFKGETGTLSRYGLSIEEGLKATERFNAVLDQFAGFAAGRAAMATDTLSGGWTQMSNAIGDVWKAMGRLISRAGVVVPVLKQITNAAAELAKAMGLGTERENIEYQIEKQIKLIEKLKTLAAAQSSTEASDTALGMPTGSGNPAEMKQAEQHLANLQEIHKRIVRAEKAAVAEANKLAKAQAQATADAEEFKEQVEKSKKAMEAISKSMSQSFNNFGDLFKVDTQILKNDFAKSFSEALKSSDVKGSFQSLGKLLASQSKSPGGSGLGGLMGILGGAATGVGILGLASALPGMIKGMFGQITGMFKGISSFFSNTPLRTAAESLTYVLEENADAIDGLVRSLDKMKEAVLTGPSLSEAIETRLAYSAETVDKALAGIGGVISDRTIEAFDNRVLLRGKDEEKIKAFFDQAIAEIEQTAGIRYEQYQQSIKQIKEEFEAKRKVHEAEMDAAKARLDLATQERDRLVTAMQAAQSGFASAKASLLGVGQDPSAGLAASLAAFQTATGEGKAAAAVTLQQSIMAEMNKIQNAASQGLISSETMAAKQAELLGLLEQAELDTVSEFEKLIETQEVAITEAQAQADQIQSAIDALNAAEQIKLDEAKDILLAQLDQLKLIEQRLRQLPAYQGGGSVDRTGLGLLHAGETVIPKGGGPMNFNFHISGGSGSEMAGALQKQLVPVLRSMFKNNAGDIKTFMKKQVA